LFDSLRDADNYADWIAELIEPHLGDHVLEVGAGHGDLTERLRRDGSHVVATETDRTCAAALEERYASDPDVEIHQADLVPSDAAATFDSIVAINVVEHLQRDDDAMALLANRLRPGGRLVLVVPAFDALSSDADARIGHRRRYRTSDLALQLDRVGLRVVDAQYFNVAGALAWWLLARQLGWVPGWSARLLDDFAIPVTRRFEADRATRFGQSLLCVGERPVD
jgi:SAM-dependent methyltransferase